MLRFASLTLVLATTACTGTSATDLASLPSDTRIDVTGNGEGIASITVLHTPNSDGDCLVLDATATENGTAMEMLDPGHYESTWGDHQCRPPEFQIRGRVGGPAASTFELSDGTATVAIDVPAMFAPRALTLAPVDTIASGDHLAVTATTAPADKLELGFAIATRDDLPPEHVSCSNLFNTQAEPAANAFTFDVPPDLFTTLDEEGCAFDFTRGQSIPADLVFQMQLSPAVARCEGVARCSANIMFDAHVRSTLRP